MCGESCRRDTLRNEGSAGTVDDATQIPAYDIPTTFHTSGGRERLVDECPFDAVQPRCSTPRTIHAQETTRSSPDFNLRGVSIAVMQDTVRICLANNRRCVDLVHCSRCNLECQGRSPIVKVSQPSRQAGDYVGVCMTYAFTPGLVAKAHLTT
jgi:hypothetical protein